MKLIYISFFGLLGVISRYFVGILVNKFLPHPFPLGTFFINGLGAFLIGAVYVFGIERNIISPDLRLGLAVGFLGGFTTFSSYSLETVRLVEESKYLLAGFYFGISPILGIIGTASGMYIARKMLENSI